MNDGPFRPWDAENVFQTAGIRRFPFAFGRGQSRALPFFNVSRSSSGSIRVFQSLSWLQARKLNSKTGLTVLLYAVTLSNWKLKREVLFGRQKRFLHSNVEVERRACHSKNQHLFSHASKQELPELPRRKTIIDLVTLDEKAKMFREKVPRLLAWERAFYW